MIDSLDIAEVARRTGLSSRALRFYEARGLLQPLRTMSGRRHYGPGELGRLHQILALKRAGLTLAQVQRLLSRGPLDFARLIDAQLTELNEQAAAIDRSRTLLTTVKSRVERSEHIDVATFCSLIEQGETTMANNGWDKVADKYLTGEERADFAASYAEMPEEFDQAEYGAKWKDLGGRIKAALPLDPAGPEAQAFLKEWGELLAPFNAVATPAMKAGVQRMYENMDQWQGQGGADPGFDVEVFKFIQSAMRAKASA